MSETTSLIDQADEINRNAAFLPQHNENERPALRIGGALIFAYVDSTGVLRVNVDTEEADELPEWRYGVPMRINVNSGTVFTGTDVVGPDDPTIIRHNTDSTPAVVIRPDEPWHVFGDVDIITGQYGAAEKLAELDEDDD